jgi:hypothetical protein
VGGLEQMLLKDRGSLSSAETQYRDQLTERITLLLTISQYMHKILGVDKTPVRTTFDRYLLNPKLNIIHAEEKRSSRDETIHEFQCIPQPSDYSAESLESESNPILRSGAKKRKPDSLTSWPIS